MSLTDAIDDLMRWERRLKKLAKHPVLVALIFGGVLLTRAIMSRAVR